MIFPFSEATPTHAAMLSRLRRVLWSRSIPIHGSRMNIWLGWLDGQTRKLNGRLGRQRCKASPLSQLAVPLRPSDLTEFSAVPAYTHIFGGSYIPAGHRRADVRHYRHCLRSPYFCHHIRRAPSSRHAKWHCRCAHGRLPGLVARKVSCRNTRYILGMVHPFPAGCCNFFCLRHGRSESEAHAGPWRGFLTAVLEMLPDRDTLVVRTLDRLGRSVKPLVDRSVKTVTDCTL